jgi:hypothetical protein
VSLTDKEVAAVEVAARPLLASCAWETSLKCSLSPSFLATDIVKAKVSPRGTGEVVMLKEQDRVEGLMFSVSLDEVAISIIFGNSSFEIT